MLLDMQFLKKTIMPLLGIVLVLAVLWIAFSIWLHRVDEETGHEVENLSPVPNQHMCMNEAAKRISECGPPSCYGRAIGFGANCLLANKTGRELFCSPATSPAEGSSQLLWRASYCSKYHLSKDGCESVLELITSYCSGEFPSGR